MTRHAYTSNPSIKAGCSNRDLALMSFHALAGTNIFTQWHLLMAGSKHVVSRCHMCLIGMQAIMCARTHGSMLVTAGEDRKVAFTDFDGTAIANFSVQGVPRCMEFSGTAATAAQLAVLDDRGICVVDVRAALASKRDAVVQLRIDSSSDAAANIFWCAPGNTLHSLLLQVIANGLAPPCRT